MAPDITKLFTRKERAKMKKRQKCAMSKCPDELKEMKDLEPIVNKETAKKCNEKPCLKYYSCAASKELKPMNITKKRSKGDFVKDFKDWQKELKKKCGSGKECEKSMKCSQKISKRTGYAKAFLDLIECKLEKC
jgi:predicted ATP-binding protein involved in virulence